VHVADPIFQAINPPTAGPLITEGMHLESVQRHRHIQRFIEDSMFSWGYRGVQTPLLDDYETYRDHIEPQLLNESYRLIDRSGKIMLLRSDSTLFLTSQLGRHLCTDELPMRLCYADTIVRYQSDEEIYNGSGFQTGAELIGIAGTEGDAEILLLAAAIFRQLSIAETALHIGSRQLIREMWPSCDRGELNKIADAVRLRQFEQLSAFPAPANMKLNQSISLLSLIAESNTATETLARIAPDLPTKVQIEADRIIYLAQLVQELEPQVDVRVDFSETGSRAYYSGMAFQIYCRGAAQAAASGGRYDHLLKNFGCDSPSVGFSLMQQVIEPLASLAGDDTKAKRAIAAGNSTDDFRSRYLAAQKLRQEGKAAHI
jgi:ATP phosphoribosyltransferase regulatory subunit